MRRVLCPRHEEDTPSCVVYSTHAFCFGACQTKIPLSELGLSPADTETPKPREDVTARLQEIAQLPVAAIRGLSFPTDGDGYFVVWPSGNYYKYRRYGEGTKYVGPSGHTPPVFVAHTAKSRTCLVVEGEINALSVAATQPDVTVLSPGGAGQFYSSKTGQELLSILKDYDKIVIVVDNDAAGAKAAIELKGRLVAQGKWRTTVSLWDQDANDLLVQYGPGRLKEELRRSLT